MSDSKISTRQIDIDGFFSADEIASIKYGGPIPLYYQLYQILKSRVTSGRLKFGDVFPGEQKLANALPLSRITVNKAFHMMVKENLIRRQRGIGSYVIFRPPGCD